MVIKVNQIKEMIQMRDRRGDSFFMQMNVVILLIFCVLSDSIH